MGINMIMGEITSLARGDTKDILEMIAEDLKITVLVGLADNYNNGIAEVEEIEVEHDLLSEKLHGIIIDILQDNHNYLDGLIMERLRENHY